MGTAFVDRVVTLEAVERHGSLVRLVRQVRVVGLNDTDYKVLFSALSEAGVPAAGSRLDSNSDQNLILIERVPRLVDKDVVDVDLVYEFILNEGQSFDAPAAGLFVGRVRASLSQESSNLDGNGGLITVEHTYPEQDEDFPNQTRVQGGEIQFFQAQKTLSLTGIKVTPYPWLIANSIIGAVNSQSWSGGIAHTWICLSCAWELYDIGKAGIPTNRYKFDFEFQFNPDTWNPTVVFIDERTGKPPPGLIQGVGYKTIRKHPEVDFEQLIGTRLQGG